MSTCPNCGHTFEPSSAALRQEAIHGVERALLALRTSRHAMRRAGHRVVAHGLDGTIDALKSAIELFRAL